MSLAAGATGRCARPPSSLVGAVRFASPKSRIFAPLASRRVLRNARAIRPVLDLETKLKAVRRGAQYSFPTADLKGMPSGLDRLIAAGRRLVTDAEVLQEILHRYTAVRIAVMHRHGVRI